MRVLIWRFVQNPSDQNIQNKLFLANFGMFLHIITSVLATVWTGISGQGSEPGGMDYAGEGTEICADEAGQRDATFPARGKR